MKLTPLLPIFIALLAVAIPFSQATAVNTYSFISTNEAYTIGAVHLGNITYLASDTTLYKIQNNTITQVLEVGDGYRFTGIATDGSNIYLTAVNYAKNTSSGSGGGGGGAVIEIAPEQGVNDSGEYDVKAFTLYEISTIGQVQNEYALNITSLHIYNVEEFTHSLHLINAAGTFYAYGYAHADNGTDVSYIYKITTSWSLVKQYWGKDIAVLKYIDGKFYASIEDVIYEYDSSFNLLKQVSDLGGYTSHFNDIISFNNTILLVGWATDKDNNRGAMFYETDENLSSGMAYRFYPSVPDFEAVSLFNTTSVAIVDEDSTVHIFEYTGTWQETHDFSTNRSYIKDMHHSIYYSLPSTYESESFWIETFGNNTLWGGLYYDGTVDNGYFTMTQTPADWSDNSNTQDLNPGSGGSWIPFINSTLWSKYKYYVIGFGALFLLAVIFAGGRRNKEVR